MPKINAAGNKDVSMIPKYGYGRRLRNRLPNLLKSVEEIVIAQTETGKLVQGPWTKRLKKKLERRWGVASAVITDCGSSALWGALQGLDLPPGSEVIVPSLTFFSTANAINNVVCFDVDGQKRTRAAEGLIVRFVDVDDSYTISPAAIRAAINGKTRAIIPVHLNGMPADMAAIMQIAEENNLTVIEDSAQAEDAQYQDPQTGEWHFAGSLAHVGCFSLAPVKVVGSMGTDYGVITVSRRMAEMRPEYDAWLRGWVNIGRNGGLEYTHEQLGQRTRGDEYSAREVLEELELLPAWLERRREIARRFDAAASRSTLGAKVLAVPEGRRGVYFAYPVRFESSEQYDEFKVRMAMANVEDLPYYTLQHEQQQYKAGWFPNIVDPMPNSEHFAGKIAAVPIYPELTEEEIRRLEDVLAS